MCRQVAAGLLLSLWLGSCGGFAQAATELPLAGAARFLKARGGNDGSGGAGGVCGNEASCVSAIIGTCVLAVFLCFFGWRQVRRQQAKIMAELEADLNRVDSDEENPSGHVSDSDSDSSSSTTSSSEDSREGETKQERAKRKKDKKKAKLIRKMSRKYSNPTKRRVSQFTYGCG